MRNNGARIAREKIFAFAEAEDQWGAAARADNDARMIHRNDADSVCADDFLERIGNRLRERMSSVEGRFIQLLVVLADEVR